MLTFKNGDAQLHSEELYKSAHKHIICHFSFTLVYSVARKQVGWTVDRDSSLAADDIKTIVDKEIKGSEVSLSITNLISSIRIGVTEKINAQSSVQKLIGWFKIFFQIAMVIGCFGNVACIITILSTKLIQSNVNKYIIVLLMSDTMFNIWMLSKFLREKIEKWNFWGCVSVQYVAYATMCASSNVLVLLTTERFLAIIFPLRHMQYNLTNRWIIALIALLPAQILIFYFHLRPYINAETFIVFEDGVCYPQAIWNVQMIHVPFHLSLFIIPLFIIVFVNFVIAVKLQQQSKNRLRSTKLTDGNNKTLWILPMVYAGLSTPSFTLSLVKKFGFAPPSLYDIIDVAHELLFHINMLDFAYNWLLYAMTSFTFRATFISFRSKMCWRSTPRNLNDKHSHSILTKHLKDTMNENTTL